jgi:hypothetical protein
MLYVALSSLQGRPMARAFDELASLGVGIQLTPGNLPTEGFIEHVTRSGVATRRHHGFAFDARRATTWDASGACAVTSESVHPPEDGECAGDWRAWYAAAAHKPMLEVMYPGYAIGSGAEVEAAMTDGITLAVDVSHVFIQRTQGVMDERAWKRLAAYPHIGEIHVSANHGRHDTHEPLRADSFGLDWARERRGDVPIVIECYMHRLSHDDRRRQIDFLVEDGR